MPSSHATLMGYSLVIAALMHSHRRRLRHQSRTGQGASDVVEKLELVGLAVLTLIVTFARVYLGFHSTAQVLIGLVGGGSFAYVWFGGMKMALEKFCLGKKLQKFCSPYLELRNSWGRGYVHRSYNSCGDDDDDLKLKQN